MPQPSTDIEEPPPLVLKKQLNDAYEAWIAAHADKVPPSETDDVRHMKSLFSGVSRQRVRELRRALAPEEWKEKGRRRKLAV